MQRSKGFSSQSSLQAFKRYTCIYKEQKGHSIKENQQHISSFFHLFKDQIKKCVALLTRTKGKTAMSEWENDGPDKLRSL